MSSANPIIPPGSPLHRTQPASNSKLLVSVFAVIVVHVFLLAGVLIQGCQRQDTVAPPPEGITADAPPSTTPLDNSRIEPMNPAPEPPIAVAPVPPARTETVPAARPEPPSTTPTPNVDRTVSSPAIRDVPPPTPATKPAGETVRYVVKSGDTLTKIARVHHTTVQAIRSANNLKTDRILVGQKLKVPAGDASAESASRATTPAEPAPQAPSLPQ